MKERSRRYIANNKKGLPAYKVYFKGTFDIPECYRNPPKPKEYTDDEMIQIKEGLKEFYNVPDEILDTL